MTSARHGRRIPRAYRRTFVVLGIAITTGLYLPVRTAVYAQSGPDFFDDFVAKFMNLNSLNIESTTRQVYDIISCEPVGPGVLIEGSFTYTANASLFVEESWLDPSQFPDFHTRRAYTSGGWHQYFDMASGTASLKAGGDYQQSGLVLPNPILAMTQFATPVTDANAGHQPTFIESKAALQSVAEPNWTLINEAGQALYKGEFPGGTYAGHQYIHIAYFSTAAEPRLIRVDRVATNGVLLTRTRFDSYRKVAGSGMWPGLVIFQVFDDGNGETAGTLEMQINTIEINDPANETPEIFDVDLTLAQRIWLEDANCFLE